MNGILQRRDPPDVVLNLFADIQDGRILMALLEELTGCKLLYRFRSSPHRIFRLNNISKALAFLDDRHVKLLSIDASGIADGVPSVVLSLLWNIILHFQVKEVMGGLRRPLSSSLSSLSMSSYPSSNDLSPQPNEIGRYSCSTLPSKGRRAARQSKYHGKAIKILLQWVQRCTSTFGVEVHDFGKSWKSGLAFLALIKFINPALVDLRESLSRQPRENIQLAFMIAHHSLEIAPLLELDDVSCTSPDEKSIITYVSMFLRHCSGKDEDFASDVKVPEIPNFNSPETVGFGETLADDPKAQALLKGLEKSNEQLLWKQWGPRRVSGSRTPSALKPPSPLDVGVVSQEIRSWMEKVSDCEKSRVDETFLHFSSSSEEGIYCLPALDSDEEEAYSYILDLNEEVFQPYTQLRRHVARVEEETAEDMFLNGLEACEMLNGKGSQPENVDSGVRFKSVVRRKSGENKNESSFSEMVNNRAVFDVKAEVGGRSKQDGDERRVVRRQSNDDGDHCEEERTMEKAGSLTETEDVLHEAKKTTFFEVASLEKVLDENTEGVRFDKSGQSTDEKVADGDEEEDSLVTFCEEQDAKRRRRKQEEYNRDEEEKESLSKATHEAGGSSTRMNVEKGNERKIYLTHNNEVEHLMDREAAVPFEHKGRECKINRRKQTDEKATTTHKVRTKNDTNGGVSIHSGDTRWIPPCSKTFHSFSEGRFSLQSFAALCDITPFELESLLVLWIVLYCCLILHQMDL
ncbi:uncharacterized protein V6R79_005924 [Siganus canaliculatus]